MSDQVKAKITIEEFMQMPETTQIEEIIEGELIVSPPPTGYHQFTSGDLYSLLKELIPNGRMVYSPAGLRLDDEHYVEPDLFWLAEGGRCNLREDGSYFIGAPALIVEILSPGTERHDRITKFRLYERHCVDEYWIADPVEQFIEVFVLRDGQYIRQGIYEVGDTSNSPILGGKTVDLSRVFKG
jgi:Uma2 family endonuclease